MRLSLRSSYYKFKIFVNKICDQSKTLPANIQAHILDLVTKFTDLYQTNFDLGIYHYNNSNYSDAIFRFWLINKFKPNQDEVLYWLAKVHFAKNEINAAQEYIEQAIKLKPKNKQYLELKTLIANIDNIKEIPDFYYLENRANIVNNEELAIMHVNAANLLIMDIEENLTLDNYSSILDYGCGFGQYSAQLCEAYDLIPKITAYDNSKELIKEAKLNTHNQQKIFEQIAVSDLVELEIKEKYDLIISGLSLHNKIDISSALTKLKKNLNKDGKLALQFMLSENGEYSLSAGQKFYGYSESYLKSQISLAQLNISSINMHEVNENLTVINILCTK